METKITGVLTEVKETGSSTGPRVALKVTTSASGVDLPAAIAMIAQGEVNAQISIGGEALVDFEKMKLDTIAVKAGKNAPTITATLTSQSNGRVHAKIAGYTREQVEVDLWEHESDALFEGDDGEEESE